MLASVPQGVSEYSFKVGKEFFIKMENHDVIDADIDARLRIEHKNGAYYCLFTLTGHLTLPCDRCLDPMTHQVDTTYAVTVKYGPEYDDSADSVLVLPETEPMLDTAPLIYDTAVLTIPMRCVHPDGECNPAVSAILADGSTDDNAMTASAPETPAEDTNNE